MSTSKRARTISYSPPILLSEHTRQHTSPAYAHLQGVCLHSLSLDVLSYITDFLKLHELWRLSQVCTSLRAIAYASIKRRYDLEMNLPQHELDDGITLQLRGGLIVLHKTKRESKELQIQDMLVQRLAVDVDLTDSRTGCPLNPTSSAFQRAFRYRLKTAVKYTTHFATLSARGNNPKKMLMFLKKLQDQLTQPPQPSSPSSPSSSFSTTTTFPSAPPTPTPTSPSSRSITTTTTKSVTLLNTSSPPPHPNLPAIITTELAIILSTFETRLIPHPTSDRSRFVRTRLLCRLEAYAYFLGVAYGLGFVAPYPQFHALIARLRAIPTLSPSPDHRADYAITILTMLLYSIIRIRRDQTGRIAKVYLAGRNNDIAQVYTLLVQELVWVLSQRRQAPVDEGLIKDVMEVTCHSIPRQSKEYLFSIVLRTAQGLWPVA